MVVKNDYNIRTIIVPKSFTDSESKRFPPIKGTTNFKDIPKTIKFLAGMKDFYQNTTFGWFKYQDDDGAIYVPNFIKMINELNKKHKSTKEVIIKGCCSIDNKFSKDHKLEVYIQGGTGMIISRATMKFFIDNFDPWYYSMDHYEDRHMMKLIKASGVTPIELSSPYFIGDPLRNQRRDVIRTQDFKSLPRCPEKHPYTLCKEEFYQFNKIASFHKYSQYDWIVPLLDQNLIPDNVKFYNNDFMPTMCYQY